MEYSDLLETFMIEKEEFRQEIRQLYATLQEVYDLLCEDYPDENLPQCRAKIGERLAEQYEF